MANTVENRRERGERRVRSGRKIRRFSVLAKIVIIGILGNLPIAFIAFMYTSNLNEEIASAARDRDGAVYLRAVWPVYQATLNGRPPTADELEALTVASTEFGAELATTLYSQRLLDLSTSPGPAAVDAGQTFLNRIADNSGLGVGANVGLHDASAIVAEKLPEIAAAAYILNNDLISGQTDVTRQKALTRFEYAGDLLLEALGAADVLNFDTEMTARMSNAQSAMFSAQRQFAAAAAAAAALSAPGGDLRPAIAETDIADELRLSYGEFQTALSEFWLVSAEALTVLLNNRIEQINAALRQQYGIVVSVYVFIFGLIWLVARSVSRRVRSLMQGVETMQAGDLDVAMPNTNLGDEIGDMARAVEAFRLDLLDKRAADDTLQRHNVMLEAQRQELKSKNIRFEAMLNNMSHGLVMFGSDHRLAVWNRRFAELYNLPEKLLVSGTHRDEIAKHSFGTAKLIEPALAEPATTYPAEDGDFRLALEDGRVLFVSQRTMRDGGVVVTHEDITERRRAEEQIAYLAYHDSLTRLPNRVLFKSELDQALSQRSVSEYVAILCLDLDHFKSVNDTLGHPVGDGVLKEVSERLRSLAGDDTIVARLSGDEFAIVATEIENPTAAGAIATQIVDSMTEPFEIEGNLIDISTSVGIALAPNDGSNSTVLLKNADMALYRAKGDGRGTHRFFEPAMDAEVRERRALEVDLRKALNAGEFELFYQPLIDLKTDRAAGFEALLRWHHPRSGLISPAVFIPVAEETGLIVAIGEWVLRQACATAATWPAGIRVAVNLSPVQVKHRGLIDTVMGALSASGLHPSRLDLEITESVFLQEDRATLTVLHQIRELGAQISMDDFGTGFSSLSYLRSFPFDKIKIDRSFVHSLTEAEDGMAIVRAVAGLGKGLRMTTTAEGVETTQQLDLLKEVGYSEVQGFLFSPAKPASEVTSMLARFGWPEIEESLSERQVRDQDSAA